MVNISIGSIKIVGYKTGYIKGVFCMTELSIIVQTKDKLRPGTITFSSEFSFEKLQMNDLDMYHFTLFTTEQDRKNETPMYTITLE